MTSFWVTFDISCLLPPHSVPKYYLSILYLFLSFHLSFYQLTPNQHHLLSWTKQWSPSWSPVTHFGFPCSSFSYYNPQGSFQKAKLIISLQFPLQPLTPASWMAGFLWLRKHWQHCSDDPQGLNGILLPSQPALHHRHACSLWFIPPYWNVPAFKPTLVHFSTGP